MARRRYAKKARKVPRKRTVIRKALRSAWKKSVAKVVKGVLSKQVEVKRKNEVYTFAPYNTLATVANIADQNILWISPNGVTMPIVSGTRQDERIGNRIRTHKCKVKVIMYPKPYDSILNPTPQPQVVTIWCVSARIGYASNTSMAQIFDTNFFQDGFTSTGYTSNLIDSISEVNSDAVTLHWKRTYKLGHATHYAQPNQATEPYPSNVQFSNNDYKMNIIREFDLTKALKKTFVFDDSNNTPNDRSTFLIFGVANANGQNFVNSGYRPLDVYATVDYHYTDM